MKKIYIVAIILSTWALDSYAQDMSDHWIIGEWKGDNRTLSHDGSGEYDVFKNLTVKITPTPEGYGHHASWFDSDGTYTGTSVRTYLNDSTWLNQWYNTPDGSWSDKIEFHISDNMMSYEAEGEDNFGKFELKRIHHYDQKEKIYTYTHHRKYEGFKEWWLIDEFIVKRLK